jgi:chorismate mutase
VSNLKLKHLIAGPCSAETEEQVLSTAKKLVSVKELTMFRAGIWKPRTNPNSFEGVGEKGLPWLQKVKNDFGLKVITEVATPKHVEACLKHNIDAVWIGARTTVNPFYVQEIAESLKGVNIPVYIKNPISPDFGLWAGAIERFKRTGTKQMVAIHRGFYSYEKQIYRNSPIWEIPVKLKTEFPDLDIICDPSHISGNSKLIQEVANEAMFYGMNGLMVETHVNPKEALSDKAQQVSPKILVEILNNLSKNIPVKEVANEKLSELRKKINQLDSEVLNQLSKRFQVVREIVEIKKEETATFFQLNRWKNIIEEVKKDSKELNLDEYFIEELFSLIHKESLKIHQDIYKN